MKFFRHPLIWVMVLIISSWPGFLYAASVLKPSTVCFQSDCINVEVVSRKEDTARGLSGRDSLALGQGMLFVFSGDGIYNFWMKGMKFPLDIIWIGYDGQVKDVMANLPACAADPCPVYVPSEKARYVLEIPAGFAAAHGITKSSRAKITF